jgi:hypothetical protein
MDVTMRTCWWLISFLFCGHALAADELEFKGIDYSGTYECQGDDSADGLYTGTAKLQLVLEHSYADYGAYDFTLAVPTGGLYIGHAAAQARTMAIHFALTNSTSNDFATGIAQFSRLPSGKWQYFIYYYQPNYQGGNIGVENCEQQ